MEVRLDRIDEVHEILQELYDELYEVDKDIYSGLNGGIVLEEGIKYHPEGNREDLIILGEYCRDILGKQVKIYYGSFMKMYGYLSREDLKDKLRKTFQHELTHHVEFLAKEYDLEIEDRKFIKKYKEKR
ncbi:MAG: metallopeptidase family protein [Peptoniphilaceae bacterium]